MSKILSVKDLLIQEIKDPALIAAAQKIEHDERAGWEARRRISL